MNDETTQAPDAVNDDPTQPIEVGASSATTDEAVVWRTDYVRRKDRSADVGRLRRRSSTSPTWAKWALGVPTALLALVVLLVGVDVAASAGRVHPGVRVAGVAIGGKTPASAVATLERQLGPRLGQPVVAAFEKESWSYTGPELGARLDATTTVLTAMKVGRTGTLAERVAQRASAYFRPVETDAKVLLDGVRVSVVLGELSEAISVPPKDATIVIEKGRPRLVPSKVGIGIRATKVRDDITRALVSAQRTVPVSVEFVPVAVTDDDAQQALADARVMLAGPVTITYEAKKWEFPVEAIAGWIAFRQVSLPTTSAAGVVASAPAGTSAATTGSGSAGGAEATAAAGQAAIALEAYVAADEVSRTVMPKTGEVGRAPKDASFRVSSGRVQIVPSERGVGPDMIALADELTVALKANGERAVELRTRLVQPAVTTEKARGMGIKERLATYTTTYDPSNRPRVNNIHTLAEALDGTLIAPGGVFSFNGAIGPRTAAKGYQEAPAIVNGKLVPQLGGGICQVGTTVFNAVFFSGLPVVERKNHSFYISHYPKGRDATVSWGGPDIKFRNDTEHWVLIATAYSRSSLTVSLYGTDPGYEVDYSTGPFTNLKPHPVDEIKDSTMPVGSRIVEDGGVDGRRIVVTRTVTLDGRVVRTDTFVSVYAPKREVVRVGTKPIAATSTPTP